MTRANLNKACGSLANMGMSYVDTGVRYNSNLLEIDQTDKFFHPKNTGSVVSIMVYFNNHKLPNNRS